MKGKQRVDDQGNMSLIGHLAEIRNRIAICIAVLVVAFFVSFAFIKPLASRLLEMGLEGGFQYVYLTPSELLTSYVKLSLILAVVIVSPVLIYHIWAFAAPALTKREKRAIRPALAGGLFFFALGAAFSYLVALPFVVQFLVNYSESEFIGSAVSVASYLDFMLGMMLTFGVVFEEPMLALVLSNLGLLTPMLLRKVRQYAIPLIFIVAAVITPPEAISQLMVAFPMIGLYELSIVISSVIYKRRQKRAAMEESGDDDDDDDDEENK